MLTRGEETNVHLPAVEMSQFPLCWWRESLQVLKCPHSHSHQGSSLLPASGKHNFSKSLRLMERKVCFILDAGNWGGGWTPVQRPTPSRWQSGGKNFYRQREGAPCRNSTVSPDNHLEIGHRWCDQHHLDCFKYSQSSVPGSVCSLRLVLRIMEPYLVYSLVIT